MRHFFQAVRVVRALAVVGVVAVAGLSVAVENRGTNDDTGWGAPAARTIAKDTGWGTPGARAMAAETGRGVTDTGWGRAA
ncbi:hypothetical protein ACFWM7_15600 [Streptomyces sp. NPDC058375]|uniref:hypothetical protein n=1 Tax=Streptomyces sp. NPDC058375 TaxID=3346467 RepID=UPI00365E0A68